MSDFGSGHDLTVCELEPRVRFCADGSEPGTCFRFCVSISLAPPPLFYVSLKKPINIKKKKKRKMRRQCQGSSPSPESGGGQFKMHQPLEIYSNYLPDTCTFQKSLIFLFFNIWNLWSNWFPYNTPCSSQKVPSSIPITHPPFPPTPHQPSVLIF